MISAMFTFWFCPKLQYKHCKSTMTVTMTGKTKYMPPPLICVVLVFRFQEADAFISTYLPTVLNIERANLAWHFNWHLIKQTNFGIKYHHRLLCKEAEASSGILGSHGMVPYIIVAAYCYTQPMHSGYSRFILLKVLLVVDDLTNTITDKRYILQKI